MPNITSIQKYKNVHMIGIGGVSMSGIAAILINWGFNITGSDLNDSDSIKTLIEKGAKITIGHNLEHIANCDIVIYSAAVKSTDPEMQKAKELNIPTIERADFLGDLTRCYTNSICVSGTHGKTTTTSMLSLCFIEGLKDPTIQVGAYLKNIDGNYLVGNSETFIIEACEYVESFLKFSPKAEIILNIDNDHLDYFKTFDNIKLAFKKYIELLPTDGLLVINGDDTHCIELSKHTQSTIITYGINNLNSTFTAQNIAFDNDGFSSFDLYYNNKLLEKIELRVPGYHNIYNALASIALSHSYGINIKDIKNGLLKFTGANRRFEFKGKINNSVSIYDDYAHHPTEIEATAKALENKNFNNSWIVFQPHTYSRTFNLLNEFADSLSTFDNIILLDIYAARETNTYNISSKDLELKLKEIGKDVKYIPDFDECVSYIKNNIKDNDIILTLGAGTVTNIGPMLIG